MEHSMRSVVLVGGLVGRQMSRQRDVAPLTVEALATVLDPRDVCKVLRESGKQGERRRKLPPDLVMWLVVAMGLFRGLSITNVLCRLARGLGMNLPWRESSEAPTSSAVTKSRDRLGYEAVRTLFRQSAAQLRARDVQPERWRGHALYGIDGTTFTVPDSEANDALFGRPGSGRGRAAFPQFRGTLLVTPRSHIVCAAAFTPFRSGELSSAKYLLEEVEENALLLVDRLYFSYAFLADVGKSQARFLARMRVGKRTLPFHKKKSLGKNDWRGALRVPKALAKEVRAGELPETMEVRMIKYQRKGFLPSYLVTNLLDPVEYPTEDLVLLYHERWEVELCYREVKTHLAGEQVTFRSHRYDRVLQEAYGLLIAYNCVRVLMARAALSAGVEPRQLSFTDCLVRVRDAVLVMGLSSGERLPRLYDELIVELARCLLPPRRSHRVCPRAVRVKMSKFPLKRTA